MLATNGLQRPPMRCLSLLFALMAPGAVGAQSPPAPAALVQPARCALADSLLGRKLGGTRADLNAVYLPDRAESLVFNLLPLSRSTLPGIRAVTGLIRLPGRSTGTLPALELSLRVVSETERLGGTQWLRLLADDSLLGDSLPLALRRQDARTVRRVVQTATAPLTPLQTLAIVKAKRVSGDLSGTSFTVHDDDLRALRAIVIVGLCGSRRPW